MSDSVVYFRQQAERCLRLASECGDDHTAGALRLMAATYLTKAQEMEPGSAAEIIEIKPIGG